MNYRSLTWTIETLPRQLGPHKLHLNQINNTWNYPLTIGTTPEPQKLTLIHMYYP